MKKGLEKPIKSSSGNLGCREMRNN